MVKATRPEPPDTLQQSDAYRRTLRRIGAGVGDTAGFLSLHRRLLGLPVTMIPRFHTDDPACLPEAMPGGVTLLSPDTPCPALAGIGAVRIARPVRIAELPLSPDPERMQRAMHQKWRNRLRHGAAQGLKLRARRMPPDPQHWLLAADMAQARARGYRGWPHAMTLAWAQVAPADTLYVEACDGQGPVAALLFLLHGSGATYHMGHTSDRGRAMSAHNVLMWQAMQRLGKQGYRTIDLGRLHARTPGLNRFKLGSGARARDLGGTWLWGRPLGRLTALGRVPRRAQVKAIHEAR